MTKPKAKGRYHKTSSHWVRVKYIDGLWWVGFMFSLTSPRQDTLRPYDTWPDASDAIAAWVEHGEIKEG